MCAGLDFLELMNNCFSFYEKYVIAECCIGKDTLEKIRTVHDFNQVLSVASNVITIYGASFFLALFPP